MTSPVQIKFLSGDAPSGSPMTRCTRDIMIVDDQDQESDETFRVFISDPTDCVGPPAFAVVTIQDDDSGRQPPFYILTNRILTDMLCLHHSLGRAR